MYTYKLSSSEVRARRQGVASRIWTYVALRMVAALLAIGAVLFGGSAVAHADPVSFFDQWVGHDRSMQLSRDGTGTLVLGDGALNTDQWALTWKKNPSDSITITLASLVSRSGPGMGNVGEQYFATIQPDSAGVPVLFMHRINPPGTGYTFCTLPELRASAHCGA
jgi:hypothetical protein